MAELMKGMMELIEDAQLFLLLYFLENRNLLEMSNFMEIYFLSLVLHFLERHNFIEMSEFMKEIVELMDYHQLFLELYPLGYHNLLAMA